MIGCSSVSAPVSSSRQRMCVRGVNRCVCVKLGEHFNGDATARIRIHTNYSPVITSLDSSKNTVYPNFFNGSFAYLSRRLLQRAARKTTPSKRSDEMRHGLGAKEWIYGSYSSLQSSPCLRQQLWVACLFSEHVSTVDLCLVLFKILQIMGVIHGIKSFSEFK